MSKRLKKRESNKTNNIEETRNSTDKENNKETRTNKDKKTLKKLSIIRTKYQPKQIKH